MLLAALGPTWANLVTDPGFEDCATVGESPIPGWTGNAACSTAKHTGTWGASLAGNPTTLSQSIATTVGDMYDFSFWLEAPTPATFTASFGSDVVINVVIPASAYQFHDFTVSAVAAITTISFTTGAGPFLDDVSVTPLAAPEPATLFLFGGALGLFLVTRRALRPMRGGRNSEACRS
jgi:hypothetical protein